MTKRKKIKADRVIRFTSGLAAATLFFSLLVAHCSLLCAAEGPFDAIKTTYASINTLEAKFQQKILIASLKKEREFAGDFLFKRGKGFLWSYRSPKAKYFLYDGKYIWQGEEDKSFIVRDRISKEKTGGTFLDLVEDMAKMDELFRLEGETGQGDLRLLELKPKKDSTVNLAKIWIDRENLVRRIEIHEFTGNVNRIEFTSARINKGIDEGRLVFRPEKGKEIIER